MMSLLKNLQFTQAVTTKTVCNNNAGDKKAFKSLCKKDGMGVKLEYTTYCTPQQNGCIEQKFGILFYHVWVMLNSGKFSSILKNGLWTEETNSTTLLESNLITSKQDLSPFQ